MLDCVVGVGVWPLPQLSCRLGGRLRRQPHVKSSRCRNLDRNGGGRSRMQPPPLNDEPTDTHLGRHSLFAQDGAFSARRVAERCVRLVLRPPLPPTEHRHCLPHVPLLGIVSVGCFSVPIGVVQRSQVAVRSSLHLTSWPHFRGRWHSPFSPSPLNGWGGSRDLLRSRLERTRWVVDGI